MTISVVERTLPYPNLKGEQPKVVVIYDEAPHPDDLIGARLVTGAERTKILKANNLSTAKPEGSDPILLGRFAGMTRDEAAAARASGSTIEVIEAARASESTIEVIES